ncbi:MAG: tRNA (adenosine(37)-N6)-dimethylallyltransferase MiaA [Candidatus Latescibacterota bacterium]
MIPKVLIIGGPTASGKKKFALLAAEQFGGEIVSADSRKVYRHLDIGTAKPSAEDRARVKHHLIDIVNPDEPFSAGEWVQRASVAVRDILMRGKLPILSGGTGFYLQAFQEGLSEGIAPDPELRAALQNRRKESGLESLYAELVRVDPERAAELHEHDTVRIIRALEIRYSTGATHREIGQRERISGGEYDCRSFALDMDRDVLYRRINQRVDGMVREGLVEELRSVLAMGYSRDLVSLDTVGYKEWFPFLDGGAGFESCLDAVKRDSRRYAKRQLTWFRHRAGYRWVNGADAQDMSHALDEVQNWLEDTKSA